jgi:hypothetical protein
MHSGASASNVTLGAVADDGMRAISPADTLREGEEIAQWLVIVDNLQRARINYPVQTEMLESKVANQ